MLPTARFRRVATALAGVVLALSFNGCTTPPQTPVGQSWGQLNQARYGAAAVTDGSFIYVLGGSDALGRDLSAERINVATGAVDVLPWKLRQRRYHTAVWADHAIWLFGGEWRSPLVTAIERIDPATGGVTTVGQLRRPRRSITGVTRDNDILLIGGLGPDELQDGRGVAVDVFDPNDASSVAGPDLPDSIETEAAVAGGQIYVIGGWDPKDGTRQQAYVFASDTWRRLADLPWPLSAQTLASTGNRIYSFGDYVELGRVARYNPSRDHWDTLTTNYTPRRHAAAVVLNGNIYVIGGNLATRGSALDTIDVFPVTDLLRAPAKP